MADDEQRLVAAESLAQRPDRPTGILAIICLLVVLVQLLVTDPMGQIVLSVVIWIFLGCLRRRVLIARVHCSVPDALLAQKLVAGYFSAGAVFTFLPRFTVPAALARRTIWLSALSGSSRMLLAVTAIVILAASQLLHTPAAYPSYFDALYEAALATVTGCGFSDDSVFARLLHVVLAIFSVVVFAILAATLSVYFLRPEPETEEMSSTGPDEVAPHPKN